MSDREHDDYHLIEAKAVQIGAIEECDDHEGYFMTSLDDELEKKLYASVAKMHQNGELSGTLEAARETTKSVLEATGIDCAECERIAES